MPVYDQPAVTPSGAETRPGEFPWTPLTRLEPPRCLTCPRAVHLHAPRLPCCLTPPQPQAAAAWDLRGTAAAAAAALRRRPPPPLSSTLEPTRRLRRSQGYLSCYSHAALPTVSAWMTRSTTWMTTSPQEMNAGGTRWLTRARMPAQKVAQKRTPCKRRFR